MLTTTHLRNLQGGVLQGGVWTLLTALCVAWPLPAACRCPSLPLWLVLCLSQRLHLQLDLLWCMHGPGS